MLSPAYIEIATFLHTFFRKTKSYFFTINEALANECEQVPNFNAVFLQPIFTFLIF